MFIDRGRGHTERQTSYHNGLSVEIESLLRVGASIWQVAREGRRGQWLALKIRCFFGRGGRFGRCKLLVAWELRFRGGVGCAQDERYISGP